MVGSNPKARKHSVHVYAVVRIKVAVEAVGHQDAMTKADAELFGNGLPVRLIPNTAAILDAEFADEVAGYLVDEEGDPEYLNSRSYDWNHRKEPPPHGEA
ncbi:hypothetical protein [Novosphingobium sp. ES2-1]|uniref:hypothetical protein n=1 Tax=Novosphingobium sp. ES2-1 TaxID=2780074 RepID=UPI0018806563|nr:hypothetical protein [Novosphingobium sp. ES2-1]QOV96515.1 hypothetical protein IM701_19880 [Novosphingobium sp. ES2-1]